MFLYTLILLTTPISNPTQPPPVQVEVIDEEEDFDIVYTDNDEDETNQN